MFLGKGSSIVEAPPIVVVVVVVVEDPFPIDGRSPVLRATMRCRCDEKIYPIPTVFFSPVLRKKNPIFFSLSLSTKKPNRVDGRKQQKYIVVLCYVVSRRINTPLDLLTALFLLLLVVVPTRLMIQFYYYYYYKENYLQLLYLYSKLFTTAFLVYVQLM